MGKPGCRAPEVEKCLHCEKPDCDCCFRTKPHISEIIALVNVGMMAPQAIRNHIAHKGRKFGKGVKDGKNNQSAEAAAEQHQHRGH